MTGMLERKVEATCRPNRKEKNSHEDDDEDDCKNIGLSVEFLNIDKRFK